MSLELFIELLLIAGIVNGNYPCKTWELNGNNISLICRIKNQVEPVTFIDSNWNLKDKCTLNNTRKCEIFQINADTIAHTYKNEVVLMINDYERKCVINDEWTCSEGNSTFKTVVPTSKGILSDTNLTLSLLNSSTLQSVTLICYSSRAPHGYHVEFLKNGKSVDSIKYNIVTHKCTHISGKCLPDKCSCNPSGNKFTRIFPFIAGNKTTTFSCIMKFVDKDTSSIFLKISTVLFDKQAFIYIGTNTSILKPAENEEEMNEENKNVSDGRINKRTDSSLHIVNPGELIKWVAIGVAFAMLCVVAVIFKLSYRPFDNNYIRFIVEKHPTYEQSSENQNIMEETKLLGEPEEKQTGAQCIVEGKPEEKQTGAQCIVEEYYNEFIMYCQHCGENLSPTARFCTLCGKAAIAADTSSFTSKENKHLSEIMNGTVRSLAVARLQQKHVERQNTITELLCGLLKRPYIAFVGSSAEGTDDGKSDKDTIWFSDYYDGFDSLTILPDERRQGYSKIQVDNLSENSELEDYTVKIDGQNYLKNSVKQLFINDRALPNFPVELSSHGPAYTSVVYDIHGEFILRNRDKEEVDHVFCIERPDWPDKAAEWKTRRRDLNWPTHELVVKITQSGYFLTAVGNKESIESEIQWRVSFNKAELLLIETFNETQLHCILLLKRLKKNLSKKAAKCITSYTMKNIMFWCLEEKSIDFWQPSNLMCCFCFCLSKLLSFVETEFLPNYFIKEQNLFILSEFTRDKRIKTSQFLKSFLKGPKIRISLLLPSYSDYITIKICRFQFNTKKSVIETWLKNQVSMASLNQANFVKGLLALYDGDKIQYILNRCKEALDKLTNVEYTQPLIKKLQNYMGVLQYILLRNDNETGGNRRSSDSRNKYSDYMKSSASGDLTHNTLRSATCYLDDDDKERCLRTIKTVTDLGSQHFKQTHSQCLEKSLQCSIKEIEKFNDGPEIESILNIINKIDLIKTDPYTTTDEFDKLQASRKSLILVDVLNLAWKRCYFDVTFMQAELPILPKPAALELCTCIGKGQKYVSFHPFLYGLLLEYLWHEKYGSGNEEKESVLSKMKNCVSIIPDEQRFIGLNFIAYCSSLQKDNRAV